MKPERITKYLKDRGLDPDYFGVGNYYGHNWITIPVYDEKGEILFHKLRKDPEDTYNKAKYKFYPAGSDSSIFGLEKLQSYKDYVIICEGEFDCLLLQSRNINAITSTAGSGTFREEWFKHFAHLKDVYICFDNDKAGDYGSNSLALKLIHYEHRVHIISLPNEGEDVSDFFFRGGTVLEFWQRATIFNINKIELPKLTLYEEEKEMRNEIWRLSDIEEDYKKNRHSNPEVQKHLREHIKGLIMRANTKVKHLQGHDDYIDLDTAKDVPIMDILTGYNISSKAIGGNKFRFKLRAEDKTPSATAYVDNNSFYDYGDSKGGSVVDLIMVIESCEFKEALDKLKTYCG